MRNIQAEAQIGAEAITPRPDQPGRRALRIRDRRIIGYTLQITGLTAEEPLPLQEQGLGGRRRLGCGLFLPLRRPAVADNPASVPFQMICFPNYPDFPNSQWVRFVAAHCRPNWLRFVPPLPRTQEDQSYPNYRRVRLVTRPSGVGFVSKRAQMPAKPPVYITQVTIGFVSLCCLLTRLGPIRRPRIPAARMSGMTPLSVGARPVRFTRIP